MGVILVAKSKGDHLAIHFQYCLQWTDEHDNDDALILPHSPTLSFSLICFISYEFIHRAIAACSKRGVLFILLLGYNLQGIVGVAR